MNLFRTKNNVITYTVNKIANSDLYISVQNGEVVIHAPWYTTNRQIQKIVEEKKQWIIEKKQEYQKNCQKKKQLYKDRTVKLLGKIYDLDIIYQDKNAPLLNIAKKNMQVILPAIYRKMEKQEIISMLIEKMYHMVAKKEMENMLEEIRILTGLAPEEIEFIKSDKILAKCENNIIYINEKIMMYSLETIRYILLHEFCHLKYKNHTKSFYQMIETYMPQYKKYVDEIGNWQY